MPNNATWMWGHTKYDPINIHRNETTHPVILKTLSLSLIFIFTTSAWNGHFRLLY
jgi:hypothetical protein